jgi:hypothetical protein
MLMRRKLGALHPPLALHARDHALDGVKPRSMQPRADWTCPPKQEHIMDLSEMKQHFGEGQGRLLRAKPPFMGATLAERRAHSAPLPVRHRA